MVKKTKNPTINNRDHLETPQETQLETLNRLVILQKRVAEIQDQFEATEEKYKRVLADYQNQERRHNEQQTNIIKMASASLIERLLLNLDSLEMAQSHLKDHGLQIVIDQFSATLSQEGLSVIKSDGQDFDPLLMDCTEVVPGKKDKVVKTVSPGYFLFDKVLRPAKVKVGSGTTILLNK
ncbi:nucleotide exchange factor GrpE [Candidatus Collierbacteria bacterium CG10_big_fil_rev_8_21_14_0_10_43_36]|uniref:Protein GrpE n=3 Tax=Candidatus Collieribacteriota TaxID=1752725 RepID=A0A2H0DTR6_9BACT|nr:nucleotide exchange factor GrpE [bacterium]PIP85576.1 MAG: nucleotide exchange factor GrpE [Candidatus Collierbacteria bacterium CG22_combo_CG10-13_8_21_14_all_43_12]PIR99767.1 MAG: nucleotide exchange factor GrpE [Candidatus Collierbacteria bacterium CG10_big_fil_rev_8_21_14_0_10_43_36]PIZ24901.1 MAG: nucleotide exchange factor GrpE [Candidatus Collierbacteria bacterium CG_4_10_14_0_8_um_filter_43_86]PJB47901.1 MAG: nucleotide exchange factor GrpE [Candidatus Collierbacteria bacterium CG_4_